MLQHSVANSTLNTYDRGMQLFEQFRAEFGIVPNWPCPTYHVLQFIAYLFQCDLSYKTISCYLSGIGFYLKINDFEDCTQKFVVRKTLEGVKRVLESNSMVAGGGATEVALSIYLDDFARTLGSREQLAIAEFSEALQVIPKTLALNAAKDATELIAKLRVFHNAAQKPDDEKKKELKHSGLDLMNGKIRNNLNAGVLEPTMSKIKSLKFATEAAITILRIDDMIALEPEQQQDPRQMRR